MNKDYPPLPTPAVSYGQTEYHRAYTADQMRAYVDADRALREPDAALEQALEATQKIRDFGVAIGEDGYATAGANLVREALAIERALLSAAPAPVQPERKPMTEDEIHRIHLTGFGWRSKIALVRAIEVFHGITGESK